MKYKKMILPLIMCVFLAGCGMKAAINKADKVVSEENKENERRQEEWELKEKDAISDELKGSSHSLPINIENYVKQQQNADDQVKVREDKTGNKNQFKTVTIEHSEGHVVETLTSRDDGKSVDSYNIYVKKKDEKSNGLIENGEYAKNIFGNFLMDAKVIDKSLNFVIGDYELDKEIEKEITKKVTMTVAPQPDEDGAIINVFLVN